MSIKDFNKLLDTVVYSESRGDPTAENEYGYKGLFQFGKEALTAIGIKDYDNYTNRSASKQKNDGKKWFNLLYKEVYRQDLDDFIGQKVTESHKGHRVCVCPEITEEGLLMASHLAGISGTKNCLKKHHNKKDANGSSVNTELLKGYLVHYTNLTAEEINIIAKTADKTNDFRIINDFHAQLKGENNFVRNPNYKLDEKDILTYYKSIYEKEQKHSFLISSDLRHLQKEINSTLDEKDHLKADGKFSINTAKKIIEMGLEKNLSKLANIEEIKHAIEHKDQDFFIKLNHQKGFETKLSALSNELISFIESKKIPSLWLEQVNKIKSENNLINNHAIQPVKQNNSRKGDFHL
jgi:hypothetical protein